MESALSELLEVEFWSLLLFWKLTYWNLWFIWILVPCSTKTYSAFSQPFHSTIYKTPAARPMRFEQIEPSDFLPESE